MKKTVSIQDYNDVTNAVSRYVEALRIGSVDQLRDSFYKDCVTYGIVDGELMGGAGNPATQFVEANGASPELGSHIDVLDMTPFTAVVRLVTEKDAIGTDCSEYLTLIKTAQGWMIIAKAFVQFDK